MSAWVVDQEHIRVLIWAGNHFRLWEGHDLSWFHEGQWHSLAKETAPKVGKMLLKANYASVNFRYGEKRRTPSYRHQSPVHTTWSPGEVLKAINCYDYQSCEREDWKSSEAYAFCSALKELLIHSVPGYNQGPWGIEPTSVPAAVAEAQSA